jgi:hypothetical protein
MCPKSVMATQNVYRSVGCRASVGGTKAFCCKDGAGHCVHVLRRSEESGG